MKLEKASDEASTWQSKAMLVFMPVAAIAIALACYWKLTQKPVERDLSNLPRDMRASPTFELADENSQRVRLDRYLHRHPILLVFFDPQKGASANPWLKALNASYDSIEASGTIVVGVSTALPQQNRASEFALPLLTEVDPARPVHKQWGAMDDAGNVIPSVFYINRGREVEWEGNHPKALENPAAVVRAILQGRNPEDVL